MSPSESHSSTATSKPGRRIGSMLRHLFVAVTGSALLLASSAFVLGEQPAPTAPAGRGPRRRSPRRRQIPQRRPTSFFPTWLPRPRPNRAPSPSQSASRASVAGCLHGLRTRGQSHSFAESPHWTRPPTPALKSRTERSNASPTVSAYLSSDWSYLAYPERSQAFIEDRSTGERWIAPSDGREIHFSPSGRAIAWEAGSKGYTYPDMRQRAIWLAGIDGSNPGQVAITWGGRFIGWTTDEKAILVSGRLEPGGVSGLWRLEDGKGYLLLEAENVREALVSPQGGWVAFYVAFSSEAGAERVVGRAHGRDNVPQAVTVWLIPLARRGSAADHPTRPGGTGAGTDPGRRPQRRHTVL